jgi:hypothetical protein
MKQVSTGFFPSIAFQSATRRPCTAGYTIGFDRILTDELRPRQKLPSTRYLASELNVSRISRIRHHGPRCALQRIAGDDC